MKKKVLGFMIAIAAIISASAYAQTNNTAQSANSECCTPGKQDKKVKLQGERQKFNPFQGIQLSDDQQQRLKVLREGLGPVKLSKEQMQNLSDDQKKQMREENKVKKADRKKNYLNGVKDILTSEQYIVFLENCYLYSPQSQKFMGKKPHKATKDIKSHKGDKKGKDKKERKGNKEKKK